MKDIPIEAKVIGLLGIGYLILTEKEKREVVGQISALLESSPQILNTLLSAYGRTK